MKYTVFGFNSIFGNYGWLCFILDIMFPLIVSSMLCISMYANDADIVSQTKHIAEIGVYVIPAVIIIIAIAYTVVIGFIKDKHDPEMKTENGRQLIQELNSSLAVYFIMSVASLLVMIVTSSVIDNVASTENLYFINYILYFSVCCFLVYPVSNLISVAVIIFNIGQTSLLYGKELLHD